MNETLREDLDRKLSDIDDILVAIKEKIQEVNNNNE